MSIFDRFRTPTPKPEPDRSHKAARRRKQAAERMRRYREKKRFVADITVPEATPAPPPREAPRKPRKCCNRGCVRTAMTAEYQGHCDLCWHAAVARILAEPLPGPEIPAGLPEPADIPHHMKTPVFDPDLDSRLMFGHNVAFAADSGDFSPAEGMAWNGNPSERAQLEQREKTNAYLVAGGQMNGITNG